MGRPVKKPATYDDLIRVPEHFVGEIVNGELHVTPRPAETATARLDRARKLPVYAREGVRHAWLIDPTARTVEVLGLDQGGWRLLLTCGDDDLIRFPPFEAIELDLLALWGETRETAR